MFDTISGILLAGGRSTRMGKDKALLPLPGNQDHSFVEHLASLLALSCREALLVVRDSAQALEYEALVPGGVRILVDVIPGNGPLMGLYTGLKAMHPLSSHGLVLAVDMPFVQPALISFLLSQPLTEALLIPRVEQKPQRYQVWKHVFKRDGATCVVCWQFALFTILRRRNCGRWTHNCARL